MNSTKDGVYSVECDIKVNGEDLETIIVMLKIGEKQTDTYKIVKKIMDYLQKDGDNEFEVATIPKSKEYQSSVKQIKNTNMVALLFDRVTGYFENNYKFKIMYVEEVDEYGGSNRRK